MPSPELAYSEKSGEVYHKELISYKDEDAE